MVLAFGALSGPPPSPETVAKVSGIIAQCPLVRLTHPNGKVTTAVLSVLSKVSPAFQVPAPMAENVRLQLGSVSRRAGSHFQERHSDSRMIQLSRRLC